MRVVVTGADGRLGRAVVALLAEEGHDVVGIDLRRTVETVVRIDLRDLGQVYGALAGADAVVALGAIPAPGGRAPELVFGNNVTAQFNVFEAAAGLGIRRVVSASSVAAYGFPFQHRWSVPRYVPLDEDHPLLPQDCYGLSKAVGEQIAAAYCRRGAGDAVSLRIASVVDDTNLDRVLAEARDDPGGCASSLWSYVHTDDVARACLHSLTVPLAGHHALHLAAPDTTSPLPTEELLDRWFPGVARRGTPPYPRWSLTDGSRAESVLGFRPRFRWSAVTT